jgi:hypothetical protein
MKLQSINRPFAWTAIILLGFCLGLYIAEIKVNWFPALFSESPTPYKFNKSVGSEFRIFWIGSYMALNGKLDDIYNISKFEEIEKHFTGCKGSHAWLYPPTFLLMVLPLSLLPYLAALAAWISITLIGYVLILRRICPQPYIIYWILCFPGIAVNVLLGHNGLLSGTLLGGGLLFMNSSPVLAGIFFGLSFYKPQLGILIPLALLAGRHWKILGISVGSTACISIVSMLIFGPETWLGFWRNIPIAAKLTNNPWYWSRMPTIYAGIRAAGGGTLIASTLQGIGMLGVIAGVYWVWSGNATAASRAAILILGILLFTGYAFTYDYALLAIPLAWLWQEGQTTGWLSQEKPLLLWGWVMPAISVSMFNIAHWPFGVLMLPTTIALFILVLRRHCHEIGQVQRTIRIPSS